MLEKRKKKILFLLVFFFFFFFTLCTLYQVWFSPLPLPPPFSRLRSYSLLFFTSNKLNQNVRGSVEKYQSTRPEHRKQPDQMPRRTDGSGHKSVIQVRSSFFLFFYIFFIDRIFPPFSVKFPVKQEREKDS